MRRAALAMAAMVAGCDGGGDGVGSTGTDVGNPVAVDLSFTAYDLAAGAAAVDSASIAVERIRLRPAADCEGGGEIELAGPFTLDLLDPVPPGALAGLPVGAGPYCRLELRWHRDDGTGAAIRVAGSAGGDRFRIESGRNDELRIEALDGDGFQLEATTLFVAFAMAAWLDGVDLAGADREPDGSVLVSDDSNRDQLDRFEANVESATALFLDQDGDGDLDDGERDDDDALAAGSR